MWNTQLELELIEEFNNTKWVHSEEEMVNEWRSMTFNMEETFIEIQLPNDAYLTVPNENSMTISVSGFELEMSHTVSGNCFTLLLDDPLQGHSYLTVRLNITNTAPLAIYLHHRKSMSGLNNNFWFGPTVGETVMTEMGLDLVLYKRKSKKRYPERDWLTEEQRYACLTQYVTDKLKGDPLICYHVAFDSILGPFRSGLKVCPTLGDFLATYKEIKYLLWNSHKKCPPALDETTYSVSRRESPVMSPDENSKVVDLYVSYGSMSVLLEEEYELMDFGTLLGAVGGAMGMLLGWSFLDGARVLTTAMESLVNLKRKRRDQSRT